MERKYSEPAVFVFYIMIPFSILQNRFKILPNIKKISISIGFTTIFNYLLLPPSTKESISRVVLSQTF